MLLNMAQQHQANFPRTLPYPPALRTFRHGFSLASAAAILFALASDQLGRGTWIALGLLALVNATSWLFAKPFGSRGREELMRWAAERYDIYLSRAESRILASPEQHAGALIGDWASQPVTVSFQNESGSRNYLEVRLVRQGSRWFLYSPDYGEELPHIEAAVDEQEQELSIALSPLMGEVTETGGMFFLNAGGADELGKLVKVTAESGQEILLLWSDELRAELWRTSTADALGDDLVALHITGEGLVRELLPRLEAEGVMVGLNWGAEEATAFPAASLRTFLARYFS